MTSESINFFSRAKKAISTFTVEGKYKSSFFAVQLGIILLIGIIATALMAKSLSKKTEQTFELRKSIKTQQDHINSMNSLRLSYERVKIETPQLYALLVEDKNIGDVVTQFDKLADLFAINASTKIGEKKDSTIQMTISIVSITFENFQKYILALEQMPFLIQVDSANFSGAIDKSASATVEIHLFLNS